MKAISLWQHWASAIANGVKKIETRSWRTYHEGPIAIHAAQKTGPDLNQKFYRLMAEHREMFEAFYDSGEERFGWLPFGCIVAKANLVECVRTDMLNTISPLERALGDYSPGRYGWILTDITKLKVPIPAIGRQQLFEVEL